MQNNHKNKGSYFNISPAIIYCLFFGILTSCVNEKEKELKFALEQAGGNRAELEKVIDHYSKNREDSSKLEAALFLIRNMPYHSYQKGLKKFDTAFDSIARVITDEYSYRKMLFESLLDSIVKISGSDNLKTVMDIESLDAEYFIENIDLAFEMWNKHPDTKKADFDTFLNYILPYRNNDEPLEPGTKKMFIDRYNWAIDSLLAGVPLKSVADTIIKAFNFKYMSSIRTKYPVALSISHFEKSRVGICNDEVNYFVNLFRALGISSYEEIVPLYGNSYSSGHSFFRLEYGEEVYCEGDLINIYKEESIPKVYRRTYSKNKTVNGNICFYIDVTPEYKTTINATIGIAFNYPSCRIHPVLCLFHSQDQWVRVAEGVQENNKFVFNEIGTNVLYIAAYYHNGQFNAINYPFFVLPDRTIHYYKPEVEKLDSIIILRKAGLKQPRAAFSRKHWVDSLRYGIFQGANDSSFKDAQLLEGLTELNSTHIQTISVSHNKPFRYIRFWANNHTSFLSLLEFYDVNRKKLAGKIIKSNTMHFLNGRTVHLTMIR
jgi:hypothetical protein